MPLFRMEAQAYAYVDAEASGEQTAEARLHGDASLVDRAMARFNQRAQERGAEEYDDLYRRDLVPPRLVADGWQTEQDDGDDTPQLEAQTMAYPREVDPAVLALRMQGMSGRAIAAALGRSRGYVDGQLRLAGLNPPRWSPPNRGAGGVRHDFFAVIDSEEKAYWLGFFTADGSVHPHQNALKVMLDGADATHLERLREALGITRVVRFYPNPRPKNPIPGEAATLVWASPRMKADLALHGVLPRKSYTARPADVPPELVRHYWRGLVDGDGWLTKTYIQRERRQVRVAREIGLVGTRAIAVGFRRFCRETVQSEAHVTRINSSWRFQVGGFHVPLGVAELLYEGASVYQSWKGR